MGQQSPERMILYPGCLASERFPEYEASAVKVLEAIGYKVAAHPLPLCCGSSVYESVEDDDGILADVILSAADGATIVTLCGSCTQTLKRALKRIEKTGLSPESIVRMSLLGYGTFKIPRVDHIYKIIWDNLDRLIGLIARKNDRSAVIVVPCQISKPRSVFGDVDAAGMIRQIVEALGIKVLDYEGRDVCCGATLSMIQAQAAEAAAVRKFSGIPEDAMIIDACANCRTSWLRARRIAGDRRIMFLTEAVLEGLRDR